MPNTKSNAGKTGKTVVLDESSAPDASSIRSRSDRPNRPHGSIVHTELVSRNPDATRSFFEGVFGWSFDESPMPDGTYHNGTTPGGREAGIRNAVAGELKVATTYVRVADLAEAEALIEEHGGEILQPRVDVPERGSFLLFEAPGGPIMGVWQDADNA